MAGINRLFGDEDLQKIFKKYEDIEDPPGGRGLPQGAVDRLGIHPTNKPGGRKATNIDAGAAERLGIHATNKPGGRKATNIDGAGSLAKKPEPKLPQRNPQEKQNMKSFALQKEKARALAAKSQFYEACKLLEDITDRGNTTSLGTKLLMTECYVQLGRENKANKCLERIEKALHSAPVLPPSDLINLADDLLEDSAYVRAMVIVNISADILINSSADPDEIVSGVFRCCSKLDDIIKAMLAKGGRNTTIAADMGMQNLAEMLEKLGEVKNCNRDQQVVKETLCCRLLDHNYNILRDHKKCMKYAYLGIKKMEQHFTALGAQRYRIYGGQLHNLAITLGNMERVEEAAALYQRAVDAKQNAVDYENDAERKMDIDRAKRDLKELRHLTG